MTQYDDFKKQFSIKDRFFINLFETYPEYSVEVNAANFENYIMDPIIPDLLPFITSQIKIPRELGEYLNRTKEEKAINIIKFLVDYKINQYEAEFAKKDIIPEELEKVEGWVEQILECDKLNENNKKELCEKATKLLTYEEYSLIAFSKSL